MSVCTGGGCGVWTVRCERESVLSLLHVRLKRGCVNLQAIHAAAEKESFHHIADMKKLAPQPTFTSDILEVFTQVFKATPNTHSDSLLLTYRCRTSDEEDCAWKEEATCCRMHDVVEVKKTVCACVGASDYHICRTV